MSRREIEKGIRQNGSTELNKSIERLIMFEQSYVNRFKPGRFHRTINHLPQFLLARNV